MDQPRVWAEETDEGDSQVSGMSNWEGLVPFPELWNTEM